MLSNKPIYIQPDSKRIAARSRELCGSNDERRSLISDSWKSVLFVKNIVKVWIVEQARPRMLRLCMFRTIEGLSFIGPCYCMVNYNTKLLQILLSFDLSHPPPSVILYFRRYIGATYKTLAWEKYSEHVWDILISLYACLFLSDLTAREAVLSSLADSRKWGSVSIFISGLGQNPFFDNWADFIAFK